MPSPPQRRYRFDHMRAELELCNGPMDEREMMRRLETPVDEYRLHKPTTPAEVHDQIAYVEGMVARRQGGNAPAPEQVARPATAPDLSIGKPRHVTWTWATDGESDPPDSPPLK